MPNLSRPARLAIVALVLVFVFLALAYSIVNPAFESPDEIGHFGFVQHLVTTRTLPVLRVGESGEAHQPPLCNLLAAAAPADEAQRRGYS